MATPRAFAPSAVRNMVLGSPACQPQATLAEVTMPSMASSSPIRQAPNPSPMSLLRSTFILLFPHAAQAARPRRGLALKR